MTRSLASEKFAEITILPMGLCYVIFAFYWREQPLGLRWARIYKPDHMTTLFGLVGVAPFCAEFVLLAFRKASTCSPRFAVGTSQSEHPCFWARAHPPVSFELVFCKAASPHPNGPPALAHPWADILTVVHRARSGVKR